MNLTKILNKVGLYTRTQASQQQRSLKAANVGRLFGDWTTSTLSADSELRNDLSKLRARSRELKDNNEYAQKFIAMLKTNVLGENGISLRNKAKDPDKVTGGKLVSGSPDIFANKQIEDAWWEWGKKENCTVTRNLTWCDVQKIVLEAVATDGEHLIRKVRGFPHNKFKFALQLIESDLLDIELNKDLGGGRKIKMGVQLDQWDAQEGFWLHKSNPNDSYPTQNFSLRHEFVPANEIVHPFIQRRAGQCRGYPWMMTSAAGMQMLGGYEEAELVASRVAAGKMGFLEVTGDAEYTGDKDALGNKYMDADPGTIEALAPGLTYKAHDPQHPNSAYGTFMKTRLRGIAAGLGTVSYNTLANDMESVNFASGKLGLDEERLGWRMIQNWFAESVCNEIFPDWLEAALLTQIVRLPMAKFDKFNQPTWRGRRWEYVNPQQEVTAIEKRLALKLTSRTRELDKLGDDRDELFQEIKEETELAESMGIDLDNVDAAIKEAAGVAEAEAEFAPEPVKPAL
jgi:lambda family phage portal protein